MSDEDRDVDIESEDELEDEKNSGQQFQTQVSRGNVTCFRPKKSLSGRVGRINTQNRRNIMRSRPTKPAEKRAHHNALERKRRDHIKDSFTGLRDSIPSLHGEKVVKKASRAQILKKAADYIQVMRKKNNVHQQDIDDLKRQNQMLELQIRSLEKNRSPGNYNTTNMLDNSPIINSRGNSISAFDGGSGTETSDSESSHQQSRRKKMKTNNNTISSSET